MKENQTISFKAIFLALIGIFLVSGISFGQFQQFDEENNSNIKITHLSSYHEAIFDGSSAEIGAYDSASMSFFYSNDEEMLVKKLDFSDPSNIFASDSVDLSSFGGGVNGVAVLNGLVAVAIEADSTQLPGKVRVYNASDLSFVFEVTVPALPDMLTFTPDGDYILVACEGEPNDAYTHDPLGQVAIIDVIGQSVDSIDFSFYNSFEQNLKDQGIRIFGPGAAVAQDLEPEYITVDPSTPGQAFVVFQENNAIAVIDYINKSTEYIRALGYKDYSVPGNVLDPSDKDSGINIGNWPVYGMYQPDAIKAMDYMGSTYIFTANEGDARDYDGFSEEERIKDLTLDTLNFPDADDLQKDEYLGRLRVTSAYGARSFSVFNWTSPNLALTWDSGSEFETKLAEFYPTNFNSNNDEQPSFESRSDDKGPEPEAIEFGTVNGKPYVFIGLERIGGVFVYDISDPTNPEYVTYFNNRDFSLSFDEDSYTTADLINVGDLGIEDVTFIPANQSGNGKDLIVTTNEINGSVSVFSIEDETPFELTVLHNNDGESQLINLGTGLTDFGGVARFKSKVDSLKAEAMMSGGEYLMLSSGDNFLAGKEWNASLNDDIYYDAIGLDSIGYDAIAIGNHDFDFGAEVLAEFIPEAVKSSGAVYLSSNIDFSGQTELNQLVTDGKIAKSTVVYKGGQKIGIIGATTPELKNISSPGPDITVQQDVAAAVQAEIDALKDSVKIIVLISHLQSISEDSALIAELTDVDIAIAGGGDELLANPADSLIPGDEGDIYGAYPLKYLDANNDTVYTVTGKGDYSYVGRFVAHFNAVGDIVGYDMMKSGPQRIASEAYPDGVPENDGLVTSVVTPVSNYVAGLEANVIADLEVDLEGTKSIIRSQETNLGNLVTDAFLWEARKRANQFSLDSADISFWNGGGIRIHTLLDTNKFTEAHTYDIMAFGNTLTVLEIPADRLKEFLENGLKDLPADDGGFPHFAGMKVVYDLDGTALVSSSDENGVITIETPGTRVVSVTLDDGTPIVVDGQVVQDAPSVTMVTSNFSVQNNGDDYRYNGDFDYTFIGVTDQRALYNYVESAEGLNGTITAQDYPEGGQGRLTDINDVALELTVLHNNDGESQLINLGSGLTDFGGVARFKSKVDSLKAEAMMSGGKYVMLSSGDNFLAGKEWNASLNDDVYYDAIAIREIGYDALAIGNHDFDFGPEVLAEFIEDVNDLAKGVGPQGPIYLSSNIDFTNQAELNNLVQTGKIAKSTILMKDGDKIGVIGATTPELKNISSPGPDITVMQDVQAAVMAQVDTMKTHGVNKIILISHLQSIQEDSALIAGVTDIDIAIAGGGDELLANPADSLIPGDEGDIYGAYPLKYLDANNDTVYTVTGKGDYSYVGRFVAHFNAVGDIVGYDMMKSGPQRIASEAHPDGVPENTEVKTNVVDPVQAYVAGLEANVIADLEVDLEGTKSIIRSQETNLGNLVTDAFLWEARKRANQFSLDSADISFWNGGGIRIHTLLDTNKFTEAHTYDIMAFGNTLTVLEIPADRLKEFLENGLKDLPADDGGFPHFAGMKVVYDLDGTALVSSSDENGVISIVTPGSRVVSVTLDDGTPIVVDGQVVQDAPAVTMVTSNFSVQNNGDDYRYNGDFDYTFIGVTDQRALYNYVADAQGLNGMITAHDYPEGGLGRLLSLDDAVLNLTVLHNNDGESQLINLGDNLSGFGGVARFKSKVDSLKAEAMMNHSEVVMLSSGDNFLAGKEWNASLNDGIYYDAVAIDSIGYDAIAIGNHDFDFGPVTLSEFIPTAIQTSGAVYLSSNIDFSNQNELNTLYQQGDIAKYTILDKGGEKIGVIGATTPELKNISSPGQDIIVMQDVKAAIMAQVDSLKAHNVNKIILISHLQSVQEDSALIAQLTDIDIAIAGGGDELLANPADSLVPGDESDIYGPYPLKYLDAEGDTVYTITGKGDYSYVGRFVAHFNAVGDVVGYDMIKSGPQRVASESYFGGVPENAGVKASVVDPVQSYVSTLQANVIADLEVPLEGTKSIIRSQETNLGNLVTDAFLWDAKRRANQFSVDSADISFWNGGGIRIHKQLDTNKFTEAHTYDIMAFGNTLTVLDIPADRLKEFLENGLKDLPADDGGFPHFSGMYVTYDPTGTPLVSQSTNGVISILTPGSRVVSVTLENGTQIVVDGQVVQDAPSVTMVTSNFSVLNNGDDYRFNGEFDYTFIGVTDQQSLKAYVESAEGLNGTISANDYPEGGLGRLVIDSTVSVNENNNLIPTEYSISQNYPNPFNPSTTIEFGLPNAGNVKLSVYNVLGQEVASLVNGYMDAGYKQVTFNANQLASGVYYYRIQSGDFVQVKKMILLK